MKEWICTAIGAIVSMITAFYGGWTGGMKALFILMIIDYGSGLIVAGVFKKSKKSTTGALESWAGWKGLCRKVMTWGIVLVAYIVDKMLGTNYIMDAVVIGFVANEAISIAENAKLMGVPMPAVLANAIDVLTTKSKETVKLEKTDGGNQNGKI